MRLSIFLGSILIARAIDPNVQSSTGIVASLIAVLFAVMDAKEFLRGR